MNKKENSYTLLRALLLSVLFVGFTGILYWAFGQDSNLTNAHYINNINIQKIVYPLMMAVLLSGLAVLWLKTVFSTDEEHKEPKVWFYPLVSGGLALFCMMTAYAYLGMWPVGTKTGMIVDMHHQYAPLLSQLRDMLLHGGNPLYSFEVGMGASFLPLFGYYLASPFNLLLVLFPENLLAEGILFITLLKNAVTGALFALCVQSIYRRRNAFIPAVAVMYTLMMYTLAYNWNIMWLDCLMVLPLVVMGFERMMREGKYLTYVLSLAYCLYANYYIGFMVCIFMVMYYLFYVMRKNRTSEQQAGGFLRFFMGSALGGGLAMFLLIPVAMALGSTSAAGADLPELASNFKMFELFGRHLAETTPTIRSGNLPNIYCGILAVLTVPIFATTKEIPLRRRAAMLGLLGMVGISFVINQLDLVWHGLHSPNDLPYRFSFIYSFVLVLIAYETLMHLRSITSKQIAFSVAGITGLLILQEQLGDSKAYGFYAIYLSLALLLIYGFVMLLATRRKLSVRCVSMLMLLIVAGEMTFNAGDTFVKLNGSEYFTEHDNYVDNDTTKALQMTVDKMEEIGDKATYNGFYRIEFIPRRTCVDTALFDYRGITVFASSNSYAATKFMGNMGYAINGVNSHLYHSFVSPTDSLFGIRYVALEANISGHPQLKKVDAVTLGDKTYYLYENQDALPVGFMVKKDLLSWTPALYDPISSQNSLFTSLTGISDELYTLHTTEVSQDSTDFASVSGVSSFSITASGQEVTATFETTLAQGGQTFAYLDCRAADSMTADTDNHNLSVTPHEPYILDLGTRQKGEVITSTVTTDDSCAGNIYIFTLNDSVYKSQLAQLRKSGLQVTSHGDRFINGKVDAAEAGLMFTSIPYDAGWTVKVDGKKVDTVAIAGEGLLGFEVTAGSHEVELSFMPRGLLPGIAISLISLLLLLVLVRFTKKQQDEMARKNASLATDTAGDTLVKTEDGVQMVYADTTGKADKAAAAAEEQPTEPAENGVPDAAAEPQVISPEVSAQDILPQEGSSQEVPPQGPTSPPSAE